MEESSVSKEVELCPCHAGEPCIWVPKVMIGDDEPVPLGITKEDFQRFRLINCIESQRASWGDLDGPAFYEFILCPQLRNLITTLKKQISPKPRTGTRWRFGSEPSELLARTMLTAFGSEPEQTSETPKFSGPLDHQLGMRMKDKEKYRHFYCAEMALADYNKKHSTNYKLVEAINSVGFFDPSLWYHCAFRAAIDTSSAPVLFFAEINQPQPDCDEHVVNTTPILDGTETTLDGCVCCLGVNIPHPVNKFYRGLNDGNFRSTSFNLQLRFDEFWREVGSN